jgi:hypothetical protein
MALFAFRCSFLIIPAAATATPGDIQVHGPGVAPQLAFACCDQGVAQAQFLFANPEVIASLTALHAEVAVPILDLSPERAQLVRFLNQQKIPVIAWMMLPKEEGLYLNAYNAPEAAARVAAFEKWTSEKGLRWAAIGLDIEPSFAQLAALKGHRWRLITTLLRQSLNGRRILRTQDAYTGLIHQIQSIGLPVQTYAMPYLPAERSVHSSLIDRLLGTVDVRGDEEYLMLYTSYARPVGAGMIWAIGPHAQSISIGSTEGLLPAGSGAGPLNWDEFSRDLIVASHFTRHIGVYNLEGCVRQGFLPKLRAMNWSSSVTIPARSVSRAERLGLILRAVLWVASNLIYFVACGFLVAAWFIWRWRAARKRRQARA